jgi:flavin-dependent dehydrogenase
MTDSYDAIVVGARCAGSSLAMLLAREGYRVLVVDKSKFPSDMPLSTHWSHQPAIERLREWGLLPDLLASGCPPIDVYNWDIGPFVLRGSPRPAGETTVSYAPRRKVLDQVLVEGAIKAGAELRDGVEVEGLLFDGDTVTGVRGRTRAGAVFDERAAIVVGADGMESKVASWAGAAKYREQPAKNGQLWAYWSGVPIAGMEFYPSAGQATFGFPTNDGLSMIAATWSLDRWPQARARGEEAYLDTIAEIAPAFRERLGRGRRETAFISASVGGYYRKPYGPGWALVGDAGYMKDPCTASGITDAFRDAESLAEAIDAGLSGRAGMQDALAAYQQGRDETTIAHYEFTSQLAALEPPPPEMQQLFFACSHDPEGLSGLFGVVAQTVTEREFFDPANIAAVMARAGEAVAAEV